MDRLISRRYVVCIVVIAMLFLSIAGVIIWRPKSQRDGVSEAFKREYQAYLKDSASEFREMPVSSLSMGPRGLKHMQVIGMLGPKALPDIMEKASQPEDMNLTLPISLLTEKSFSKSEWPGGRIGDSRAILRMYTEWWPNGRKLTPQQFSERYARLTKLREEGQMDEAVKCRIEIRKLGIAALPMIMEKIGQGDSGLIPVVSMVTREKVAATASAEACLAWWQRNKGEWLIPFPNSQPAANAGPDQAVMSGDIVQLDGSGSTDAEKDELTYTWRQLGGPTVKLSEDASAMPTFRASEVKRRAVLTFELKVNDAGDVFKSCPTPVSESEPDTVRIAVNPKITRS